VEKASLLRRPQRTAAPLSAKSGQQLSEWGKGIDRKAEAQDGLTADPKEHPGGIRARRAVGDCGPVYPNEWASAFLSPVPRHSLADSSAPRC